MKNFVSDCDIDIDFLLNTSGIVQSNWRCDYSILP
ncbi:hypothetical protein T4C_7967 [Trichinella pseudospiralis]|uniref:Uncharacterized protein n=1 Tax=Trichinella pseudospiralis TaxID=6337 RepID=A0A0V1GK26_TRIPS|nr:hypothetical protein T4C_7967 [Trichinella pseudospiralis]